MKKRKKKVYDDDDGRVIAPMNVDGMPWNHESPVSQSENGEFPQKKTGEDELPLTPGEKRAMMGGVFAAALLVAGIFVLAALLFILFCIFVWFK